jgi:hypothetical protein
MLVGDSLSVENRAKFSKLGTINKHRGEDSPQFPLVTKILLCRSPMSPDLNTLRRLVQTKQDTILFEILQAIYTAPVRSNERRRAGDKLMRFLLNLPEFRAWTAQNRDLSEPESAEDDADEATQKLPKTKPAHLKKTAKVYSLADEANKSGQILDNLWTWLFGIDKDGIPQIDKFSPRPENSDKSLLLNMLIWLRAKHGYLERDNNREHYKQSQILPSSASIKVGDNEIGTFQDMFEAVPTAKWRVFLDDCYHDEDNSLKQPVSQEHPAFNCHIYLMVKEFRQPRPKNVEQVAEILAREYSIDIPTDTIGRLAREKFVPLLKQKYQEFLENDGELIAS